jgi:hypothetical protein
MMDSMIWPMWAMWLSWLVAVIVLVLAAAAVGKYLFFSDKRIGRDRD